ncbi:uncharacterized protein PRCAT00001848001 [Priceomyces carsonii]|uniref:uncharacterized protein n=1 Tax=Priceomyces carsonii TaxID=28549 RepID=UPI002ED994D3|nr:unnamed protein product [Priceomyces carsonii]
MMQGPATEMDEEEGFDIAKSLALSSSESDVGSDYEEGVQDIISESDEEAEEPNKKKPKTDLSKLHFPMLEISDDENSESKDISSYFVNNNPLTKKAKNGSFQSFGFSKFLLGNIAKKGYRQPTPIQRKTIPLIMDNRDVVGMARTGSGKTAAFTLPVIERLKNHSAKAGARAVILSPSRELALQTFKQVKEFSRGTDLRSIVLIGGDSLEQQFSSMMSSPDIIVATPGRFLHLKVEMDLDLSTVEYIVFDEADRLFEMGFAEQLNELIASLPTSRQSLLFSATLPRTLVDFAKAGLSNPVLVRLDTESKISDQLQMAFFTTKQKEREATLLYILQEVIKLPLATAEEIQKIEHSNQANDSDSDDGGESVDKKKRKRVKFKKERAPPANMLPSPNSTILFVPTKHHVEYVTTLLKDAGYLVSYIYGSLDQHARKQQLYQFRIGLTSILVVTDVAARGIDIPVLANVINYTLPGSSKIFVHRVGRTARAGNKGWAYSIVNEKELPYLLDLELFLGKKVLLTSLHEQKCELLKAKQGNDYIEPKVSYNDRLVLGSVPRSQLETFQELYDNLLKNHYELEVVKGVALKGEKLYHRTRQPASQESLKRSKELVETNQWDDQHLLFGPNLEKEKEKFLAKLGNRISKETIFEIKKKGADKDENSMAEFMHKRRRQIAPVQKRARERRELLDMERIAGLTHGIENEMLKKEDEIGYSKAAVEVEEEELKNTFEDADDILEGKKRGSKKSFKDPQFYLSHYAPTSMIQDQQLSLSSSFVNDASKASYDLSNDDKIQVNKQIMRWDKKKGKYINSMSTDKKYIIGESGQKIPASYRAGRYDEWKRLRNNHSKDPRSLDLEEKSESRGKFIHKKTKAPKLPDKYRDDYHKQKKKVEKALESGIKMKGYHGPAQNSEIKTTEDIRKARLLKEKRKAKNARPLRKR